MPRPNGAQRPHVLIIHTDQHRFDCLGATGNPDVQTPNVDALAADGTTYTESFCCFPVCTPSRYSLLTGQFVHQHLGWDNHCTIPSGMETFPRLLKRAGYRTAAVGKMHFTPTYLDVGFERMQLAEQHGPGRWDDDYHRYLMDRGLADRIDLFDQVLEYRRRAPREYFEGFGAFESDLAEEHHSTTWIGDRAVEELDAWSADRPALLMVGFVKPHHPFDPPAPWSRMYDPEALTLLPGWTEQPLPRDLARSRGYYGHAEMTEADLRRGMAMYYGSISQIDHHVGRMIDRLRRSGLYDRTMIAFTSDHGEYLGFHHLLLKGNALYDPLAKVPLIVKLPGQTAAGARSAALVSNVDVAPTVLSVTGCEGADGMSGIDLTGETDGHEAVFAEAPRAEEYMVRTRDRKLLVRRDRSESMLFDLEADPLEVENLASRPERQEELRELSERLARWVLFDAPTRTNLDEYACVCPAPNALALADGHRQGIQAYYERMMDSAGPELFAKP